MLDEKTPEVADEISIESTFLILKNSFLELGNNFSSIEEATGVIGILTGLTAFTAYSTYNYYSNDADCSEWLSMTIISAALTGVIAKNIYYSFIDDSTT